MYVHSHRIHRIFYSFSDTYKEDAHNHTQKENEEYITIKSK